MEEATNDLAAFVLAQVLEYFNDLPSECWAPGLETLVIGLQKRITGDKERGKVEAQQVLDQARADMQAAFDAAWGEAIRLTTRSSRPITEAASHRGG